MSLRALLTVPAAARRGEVVEVRALAQHPMETGYRRGGDGTLLPRDLLRRLEARFEGELVFSAELHAAVAANPYLVFWLRVPGSGVLTLDWQGDRGVMHRETRRIEGGLTPMWRAFRRALPGLLLVGAVAAQPVDPRRSGFEFMSPATQAMQRDDAANPAMLWVQDGRRRFEADCQRCHAADSLKGVAARHPAWDRHTGRPLTLAGRIQQCQQRRVRGPALAPESDALLGLEAFVAQASRGLPLAPPDDARLAAARERGARLYVQPLGQLRLSCAQCHDTMAGRRLGGSPIPQGHPTAYPLYRLEWQGLGSLERRLRHCQSGVRAEPFAFGSDELVALQLFLAQRAAGMAIESPGVRP